MRAREGCNRPTSVRASPARRLGREGEASVVDFGQRLSLLLGVSGLAAKLRCVDEMIRAMGPGGFSGKKTKTFGAGRVCACGAKMSQYNPDPMCALCTKDPSRVPRAKEEMMLGMNKFKSREFPDGCRLCPEDEKLKRRHAAHGLCSRHYATPEGRQLIEADKAAKQVADLAAQEDRHRKLAGQPNGIVEDLPLVDVPDPDPTKLAGDRPFEFIDSPLDFVRKWDTLVDANIVIQVSAWIEWTGKELDLPSDHYGSRIAAYRDLTQAGYIRIDAHGALALTEGWQRHAEAKQPTPLVDVEPIDHRSLAGSHFQEDVSTLGPPALTDDGPVKCCGERPEGDADCSNCPQEPVEASWDRAQDRAQDREQDDSNYASGTLLPNASNLLDAAWGVIANANRDDWNDTENDKTEWRVAAERFRDAYHQWLALDGSENAPAQEPQESESQSVVTQVFHGTLEHTLDPEVGVIADITDAMQRLENDGQRARVMAWAINRFELGRYLGVNA